MQSGKSSLKSWPDVGFLQSGQGGLGQPTNAAVGLQEFQSVNDVLRPDRQVFVATTTLFGLWFGLAHVEIPQYFQVDFDVFGCNKKKMDIH